MYYSKEMTEKARAVIAGEIDIPCPIGWHTLYESNVLCAYACTLLRLPDAGIDADAIGAEDIRIFQYGVEHNIETVTGIMYSHEAAGITDGRYDGVGGSDLYRWIIGRCDDAEKWHRAKRAGILYLMKVKHKECSSHSDFEKFCCGFLTDCQDLVTANVAFPTVPIFGCIFAVKQYKVLNGMRSSGKSSFTTLTKMGEACTMQSEFAERRWSQYMGKVKNEPESDSGIQGKENSNQFLTQIVTPIVTTLIINAIVLFSSNAAKLPVRMDNIEKNVDALNSRINTVESNFNQKIDETKSDIRDDIEGVGDDITRLENLILPFLHLKPSAEVQQQITYAYGEVNRVEQSGGLILTSASVVAYNDHGAEFTANQLSDIKLLLPYHEGKQNVFFYGQFDEENRWDGDCLVNIYENGTLKLITDAVYENGKLLNFKQAFPDTTTGGQAVWTFSERTAQDDFSTGRTWHYFRNGNYDQNFQFDSVTAKDMISADDLRSVVGTDIEGYYCGVNSDGHFNDNTGNAYMVKYFPDGLVRTLYVGAFVNGQFEDQSGNAWMIGKNKPEESYSYYKGPFKNGNPVKDIKYWQYNLTVEEINAILEKTGFKSDCKLVWKYPSV